VAFTSFGIGLPQQRRLFFILVALVAIGGLIFAVRMF
jgi:hypothetical protein